MANKKPFDFKITDNTKLFKKLMQERGDIALEAVGLQAEGRAKIELENDPRRIDTGLLRNSITHGMDGGGTAITAYKGDRASRYAHLRKSIPSGRYSGTLPKTKNRSVYIGTNVSYSIAVHEGTRRMRANRFLRNSITKYKGEYRKIFIKYLKGGK